MSMLPRQRVLTIPAGLPFLKTLAAALCDGRLTEHYRYDPADPLTLAKVTIYVPTRRAARVLRSEFVDLLGGGSAILPVIRPLSSSVSPSGLMTGRMAEPPPSRSTNSERSTRAARRVGT